MGFNLSWLRAPATNATQSHFTFISPSIARRVVTIGSRPNKGLPIPYPFTVNARSALLLGRARNSLCDQKGNSKTNLNISRFNGENGSMDMRAFEDGRVWPGRAIGIAAIFVVAGCTVQLVPPYDEVVDDGLVSFN